MIIKVLKIIDSKNNIVEFSSEYGTAIGEWRGDIPKVSFEYDVEIDIPKKLVWDSDIKVTDEKADRIDFINNKVVIVGELRTTEGNCIYIVVGTNLLISELDRLINIDSIKVICEVNKILIYDTHIW